MAQRGSEEHRRRISKGLARAWQRRKAREAVRPIHVDRWIREGTVDTALRLILEARADQVEAIIQDLGGPSEVSAMQRGIVFAGHSPAVISTPVGRRRVILSSRKSGT